MVPEDELEIDPRFTKFSLFPSSHSHTHIETCGAPVWEAQR
jgi:hypothetical protein